MKTNGQAKKIAEAPAVQNCVLVVDDNEMIRDMLSRRLDARATKSYWRGTAKAGWSWPWRNARFDLDGRTT